MAKLIASVSIIATFAAGVDAFGIYAIVGAVVAVFITGMIRDSLEMMEVMTPPNGYLQVKDAFNDDIVADPIYTEEEVVEDLWDGEVTSCELACPVNFAVSSVKALPPAQEVVSVVDYASMPYNELQAMCKSLRKSASDIKLNSKKAVLIDWLKANA